MKSPLNLCQLPWILRLRLDKKVTWPWGQSNAMQVLTLLKALHQSTQVQTNALVTLKESSNESTSSSQMVQMCKNICYINNKQREK